MNTSNKVLDENKLKLFTGTTELYRHSFFRQFLYTDGVQYVAEQGGAYWLIDEIAFLQRNQKVAAQEFQTWELRVRPSGSVILTCTDGNSNIVLKRRIPYTDFPLSEIVFFYRNNVLMLPSEY